MVECKDNEDWSLTFTVELHTWTYLAEECMCCV